VSGPIAVIGTGVMGTAMACRLLETGHQVTVFNRTPAKAELACAAGATLASSAGAAAQADTVLLSLSEDRAVAEVLFTAIGSDLRRDTVVIDTSTVSPSFSAEASERVASAGAQRIEACVLGNAMLARTGQLRVLTAGQRSAVEAVSGVLDSLGREITYLGQVGQAATAKLVFNALLGAQVAALAEAVSYGVAAGLDRDRLLTAIAGSGFSSKVMDFRAGLMRERRYEPAAFRARLMEKDLAAAVAAADDAGVAMPVLRQAAGRFADVVTAGRGDQDASALIEVQDADRGRPAG
jgi:3-hydroxyisobutyrate dehydrogenase-like beta-hydroxyacid dehydrogenase